MARTLTRALPLAAALALPAVAAAQLTLDDIFLRGAFRFESLSGLQWRDDGQRFTYLRPNPTTRTYDLVEERVADGRRRVLIEGARLVPPGRSDPLEIEDYAFAPDGRTVLVYSESQPVWRYNTKGRYYLVDLVSGQVRPLSTRPGWQQFAKFSPDGRYVGFVRDNNLFVVDLTTGEERALTTDGSETIINGTFDWVYEEELDLRDGWRWSPDGRTIAFWQLDQSPVRPFLMLDERPLYPQPLPVRYPKAGMPNSRARIGLVDVASGRLRWTAAQVDSVSAYLARMDWTPRGDGLLVQRLNRAQDSLAVLFVDAGTGAVRTLFVETDTAWVDVDDDLVWLPDGEHFVWSSERSGANQLYLYRRDGTLVRRLTDGPPVTEVAGVDVQGWVYYVAASPTPRERQVFRIAWRGGVPQRLTQEPGVHNPLVGPSGAIVDAHSRLTEPVRLRLLDPDGRVRRVLVDNAAAAERLRRAGVRPPEFFTFRTPDGVELHGWILRPPTGSGRPHPALLYVYGGPNSQTVLDSWGGSRMLWHQYLAQRGFVIVSVDGRGTGGRGRDFTKQVAGRLGQLEARDQIAAARYVARLPGVDSSRLGLWGWSYGGYLTLLTLLQPDSPFRAGIAVAPVTDWRLYDTIYTERYLGLPAQNPEGYRQGAPLSFPERLRARLLLVHGTTDDNVHFQNSVLLVEALQRAGKSFDFLMYPHRNHSISGGTTSWHLFRELTRWLEANL